MLKKLFVGALALVATVAFAQTTVPVTATFQVPAPPTAAQVAAACVASPTCVSAIAAAVSAPVVTPPPAVTPPPPVTTGNANVVYANGVLNWQVPFSYGGILLNYAAKDPADGHTCLAVTTPTGSGGWQPGYQNPPGSQSVYDTTGQAFFNISIKVTTANNTFISQFLGANDSAIPGETMVTLEKFGGPLVIGQWVKLKIALGAGGYNLPAGVKVLKFNVQENNPIAGNVYYIDNVYFSAT